MERAPSLVALGVLVALAGCGEASVVPTSVASAAPPSGTEAIATSASVAEARPSSRFVDPVRERLSEASSLRWIEAAQLEARGCIDAPSVEGEGVARLGEDVGELALGLGALERVTGDEVSDDAIATFVSRLAEEAPLRVHEDCRHVRALREHPEEYGVRRALIDAIVREIDRLGVARPDRVVRERAPATDEAALVEVVVGEPIGPRTSVPLLPTVAGDAPLWVAHPELGPRVHEGLARFIAAEAEAQGLRVDPVALARAIDALGEQDTRATLRHLAREVPVYELRFRDVGGDHVPVLSGPDASLGCRTY